MSNQESLQEKLNKVKEEKAALRIIIEQLKAQILKKRRQHALNDILLQHHESIQTRAVADLILKPEPVELSVAVSGKQKKF